MKNRSISLSSAISCHCRQWPLAPQALRQDQSVYHEESSEKAATAGNRERGVQSINRLPSCHHPPSRFEKAPIRDLTRSPVQTTAVHTSLTISEESHVMSIRDGEEW
ncbi:hypothetical protein U1Q18_038119 [Sarracenia purpurea var. burkii]